MSDQQAEVVTTSTEATAAISPVKAFVFGEKLTDRVTINLANGGADVAANEDGTTATSTTSTNTNNKNNTSTSDEATNAKEDTDAVEAKPLWSTEQNEYYDPTENNENTLFKLNCKLYLLEADKANWVERGYGILKVIDTNDDLNCNISKSKERLKAETSSAYKI